MVKLTMSTAFQTAGENSNGGDKENYVEKLTRLKVSGRKVRFMALESIGLLEVIFLWDSTRTTHMTVLAS